ncbi:multicilin [Phalacrocorax aristotelis]|uniref:multicilin n=1 Tax=Phalacrocorax aristotelis TaxID=126867 RepID=UPI003F4B6250
MPVSARAPHRCLSLSPVLTTIDWQDLAACAPTLPITPAGPVTLQQVTPWLGPAWPPLAQGTHRSGPSSRWVLAAPQPRASHLCNGQSGGQRLVPRDRRVSGKGRGGNRHPGVPGLWEGAEYRQHSVSECCGQSRAAQPRLSRAPCSLARFLHSSQGPCFQDVPEFDFQEFRDAVDYFISDASTSAPPPLDCTDFDFSLGEEVAFGPRTPQLESSRLVQTPPQRLPSPEPCWGQLVDQYQKALGDSPEANSQLQTTLTQRQVKLSTPHESTVQLKELATQARQLAAVLETMTLPQCADGAAIPPPLHPSPPRPGPAGTWGGCVQSEPRESVAGVDAMLREVSEKCHAALRTLRGSGGGTPGGIPGGSPVGSPTAKRPRPAPRLHGAFHGLRTVRDVPRPGGGRLEAGGSLRMALGEEGRMRTLSFPQGNAFTLRTAGGGYRFRWVPR